MLSNRETILLSRNRGFTKTDLLVALAIGGTLLVCAAAVIMRQRANSQRQRCVSNLKQIVQAEIDWRVECQKDTYHWGTPLAEGGTQGHPHANQAWFQWSWFSNRIGSPNLLVCPADRNARVTSHWSDAPNGGFFNAKSQDAALSYFINMSADLDKGRLPITIEHWMEPALVGDRTVRVDGPTQTCNRHSGLSYVCVSPERPCRWASPPHGRWGLLAFPNCSVALAQNVHLSRILTNASYTIDEPSAHLLVPNRP